MKKLIPYILALITFMACTAEPQEPQERIGMDPSLEGKPVTITFSIPNVQLATLSTKSSILDENCGNITGDSFLDPESLYLVVCGTNHSIKYIRRAIFLRETVVNTQSIKDYYPISDKEAALPDSVTLYTFQVQLEISDSKRTVHFLGNVDENQLITGSNASQVLPSLLSYEGKQAYWQRVFLEKIHPKMVNGNPQLDANGSYVPEDYVIERLQYIPLIRNYAKIQVTNAADKNENPQSRFHLDSYAVVYVPTRGSVVPYRTNTQGKEDDPFSFNVTQENRLSGYETCNFPILNDTLHYAGNLPSTVAINKDIPSDEMFRDPEGLGKGKVIKYKENSEQGFYIFERGVPTPPMDPTFVIIRGYFGEDSLKCYYYRLDLMETQLVENESLSQYYPIYRNFRYDIQLNRISNEGLSSPEAAANSSMVVDISADVSMRHLSDISNGRTRLVVEPFMTRTYTGPCKEGYYTLYARFFDDINSANPNKELGAVTVELLPMEDGEDDILILYDDTNQKNPIVHGGKFYPRAQWLDDVNGNNKQDDDEGGYRVISFDCKDVKYDVTKTQKIRITGHNIYSTYGERALYREVEISLQQRQEMTVACSPNPLPYKNRAKLTLNITIPAGLPSSMFPLDFIIEAEDVTLTPDNEVDGNNLPVRSGTSLSDNDKYRKKTTIQFIRTLTLEEYQQESNSSTCTFRSYFKSNRKKSATTIWVEDVDKYFNKNSDSFENSGLPTHYFYVQAEEDSTNVKISGEGLLYKLITSDSKEGEWINYSSNEVITLNLKDKVYFKAGNSNIYKWGGGNQFYCYKDNPNDKDGQFIVGGYIASLISGEDFEADEVKDWGYTDEYSFASFFKGHTKLINASDLVLPMTKCFSNCYKSLFENCTGLVTVPQNLPATVLAASCYENMFKGCTSLTSAPALPATTLANRCYYDMFYGCAALTSAPELPATTLADNCYYEMFRGCTALTTAPELPATTLKDGCYRAMFYGCTSLNSAPELPAITLAAGCYRAMFYGCTALETAPALPALALISNCYNEMFRGCSNLLSVTCLAKSGINIDGSTSNWLNGVPNTADRHGLFTYNPMAIVSDNSSGSDKTWPRGSNGIPTFWITDNGLVPIFPDNPFDEEDF